MKIESLKDLQKIIQLCRKLGVEAIEIGGLKMNLGPTPVIVQNNRQKYTPGIQEETKVNPYATPYAPGGITESVSVPTENILTEEQLLFWSAEGESQ